MFSDRVEERSTSTQRTCSASVGAFCNGKEWHWFSFLLRARARALRMLPRDLSAQVFDRTFNVFDPTMKHRRIISNHTGLIIFVAIYGAGIALTFVVFKTFEVGGVLASIAFLICAALLMVDETQEISRNAGIFAKAVKNGVGLGKGDMQVLHVIKKAWPGLRP